MAIPHVLLRNVVDFSNEAHRLVERFDRKDKYYKFTRDDAQTIRAAAVMAEQAASEANKLVGYLDAIFAPQV